MLLAAKETLEGVFRSVSYRNPVGTAYHPKAAKVTLEFSVDILRRFLARHIINYVQVLIKHFERKFLFFASCIWRVLWRTPSSVGGGSLACPKLMYEKTRSKDTIWVYHVTCFTSVLSQSYLKYIEGKQILHSYFFQIRFLDGIVATKCIIIIEMFRPLAPYVFHGK